MDGVRIYAAAFALIQQDQTVTDRMNQVDSSGAATFARTTNQFNELMEAVEERIQEEYEEAIYGKDGFYMDQLSDEVSLDEKKLDSSWSVLEKEDAALVKGVPENVYREVAGSSADYSCICAKDKDGLLVCKRDDEWFL